MSYDPLQHHRRSIRLQGYDYSKAGFYFITIVTKDRTPFLGRVVKDDICLSEIGKIVEERWLQIPKFYPNVKLHDYILMPDHIHGIIEITNQDVSSLTMDIESTFHGRNWKDNFSEELCGGFKSPSETLGAFVRGFKYGVSTDLKSKNGQPAKIFQRDYYEEIIKDYGHFIEVRDYIRMNVKKHAQVKGE